VVFSSLFYSKNSFAHDFDSGREPKFFATQIAHNFAVMKVMNMLFFAKTLIFGQLLVETKK
jgi:hypothetical protein